MGTATPTPAPKGKTIPAADMAREALAFFLTTETSSSKAEKSYEMEPPLDKDELRTNHKHEENKSNCRDQA